MYLIYICLIRPSKSHATSYVYKSIAIISDTVDENLREQRIQGGYEKINAESRSNENGECIFV